MKTIKKCFYAMTLCIFIIPMGYAQTYTNVATYAGTSVAGLYDGPIASAKFSHPYGVCSDSLDNIYVADCFNNCIRKIQNGIVTTIAGNGTAGDVDAQGINARLNHPTGVFFKNGYLYICDNLNNKIKRMDGAGNVVTIAGSGAWTFQNGPALQAAFKEPKSIAVDDNNIVYVADYENHCIRKIDNGQVTTYAGLGGVSGDVTGNSGSARFQRPRDICIDAAGNLYVVDLMNNKVKVITTGGVVNLLAGSGVEGNADGTGANASFDRPVGIDWMPSGDLCVLSSVGPMIRRVSLAGVVTTIAGTGGTGYVDGATGISMFSLPQDICFNSNGDLFVGDDNNNVIRILTNYNPKGIHEINPVGQLSVFPNPSSDLVTIYNPSNESHIISVTVFNVQGKLIKQFNVEPMEENITLNVSDLPPATYILYALTSDNKQLSSRLILE